MSWDIFSKSKIQYFLQKLKDKFVQKETGKGLSTEDYTTTEKNKLAGISTNANKVEASTTNGNIKIDDAETQVYDGSGKVDKVNGKGLSTNDYDNTDKAKVDKINTTITSISGNPISISGLKANQLAVDPIITLEPIQAGSGTPSPSNIRAISGYDKIEVLSCGVNVWDEETQKGYYNSSGVYVSANDQLCTKNKIHILPNSDYYYKVSTTGNNICYYDINGNFLERISDVTPNSVFRTNANAHYMNISFGTNYGSTYNNNISINYPATQTSYVASHKPTSISESLGQTVYGGTLDVRTGKLVVDMAFYTTTWTATGGTVLGNCTRQNLVAISNAKGSDINKKDISNVAELIVSWSGDITHFYIDTNSKALVVTLPNNTPEGTVLQFAYELATPFAIQLTPHEISLLKDYAYVSTNGTSISLDYHNGELASLGDVSQLGETVNELVDVINSKAFKEIKSQSFTTTSVNSWQATGITFTAKQGVLYGAYGLYQNVRLTGIGIGTPDQPAPIWKIESDDTFGIPNAIVMASIFADATLELYVKTAAAGLNPYKIVEYK